MNITRNNYEEFFMLYADNELPAALKKELEAFIAANPDLRQELALFQQFKLSPDASVVFENKAALLKPEESRPAITIANCASFFVLYADDELTNSEKADVTDFVYRHPQLQETFELLQQVKLSPDTNIVFENKECLYRKEDDDKAVPFRWLGRVAAAAMILLLAGIFWLNRTKDNRANFAGIEAAIGPVKQPSPQNTKETATETLGGKEPAAGQTRAIAHVQKLNQQVDIQTVPAVAVSTKRQVRRSGNHVQPVQNPAIQQNTTAINRNELKNADVLPINKQPEKMEIKRPLIAAVKQPLPDQAVIILHPDENEQPKAEWASLNNDNVEVLNTSVNTKSSLRGFLRKASRLIAKKTNAGNEEGNRKGILIGGFEIAVR